MRLDLSSLSSTTWKTARRPSKPNGTLRRTRSRPRSTRRKPTTTAVRNWPPSTATASRLYVVISGLPQPLDIPIAVTQPVWYALLHPVLGVMKGHWAPTCADCGTIIRAALPRAASSWCLSDYSAATTWISTTASSAAPVITHLHAGLLGYVSPGQYVNAGDALGEVGSTTCDRMPPAFCVIQNGSYVETDGLFQSALD